MLILALDTAGAATAVAVWRDSTFLFCAAEPMQRGQSERLIPMVNEALAAVGVSYADLDAIAVAIGPGSFTGLRVGIAAARGLALASGKPVLGVTSFAAAYQAAHCKADAYIVLESKRDELYGQAIAAGGAMVGEPTMLSAEAHLAAAGARAVITDMPDLGATLVTPDKMVAAVAEVAAILLAKNEMPEAAPFYVRPPDVTFAKART